MKKANSKPRKSGKTKVLSHNDKLKIYNRYNSKLEEFKDFTEEQLNAILESKASYTDKQAEEQSLLNKK